MRREAAGLFRSLHRAEIIRIDRSRKGERAQVIVDEDLQREFSLYHSLSLFLVESLDILSKDDPNYPYELLSLVEAVLEHPRAILYAQERKAKSELVAKLKAKRVPYEERMRRLESVSYPKPNAQEIYAAFNLFAEHHPWVGQENIRPKNIAREMAEDFLRFDDYVKKYKIERVEGLLLRYVSDTYGTLVRNVPDAAKNEAVDDIIAYLRDLIAKVDSSLLEEWESRLRPGDRPSAETAQSPAPKPPSPRELRARIRAELHGLVRALADGAYEEAAEALRSESAEPWTAEALRNAMAPFYEEHAYLRCDGDARRADRTVIKPVDARHWEATQVLCDPEGENLWFIEGIADLGAEGPSFALRRIAQ